MKSSIARIQQQIGFIREIDKVKSIFRQTIILDKTRAENDAEHSWHLAMMAMILQEHANTPDLDILHVIKMVLIHDLVEIDAGDVFIYDEEGLKEKAKRERAAADRIFGLLPEDQAKEIRALWDEFEEKSTPEAQFAGTLDRLQPLIFNCHTKGHTWKKHGIKPEQVYELCKSLKKGSDTLYEYGVTLIDQAVKDGLFG